MNDFNGIAAKVNRAQWHLEGLKAEFERHQQPDAYEIRTEVDREHNRKKLVFHPTKPLPITWPVVLGEILYDLRSSLDHAIYLITCRYAPDKLSKWTAFPICTSESRFVGSGPKDQRSGLYKLRGVPAEAVELIERIQPFHVQPPLRPEHATLSVFEDLANIDKHRALNLCRRSAQDLKATPRGGPLAVKSAFWSALKRLDEGTVLGFYEPAGELTDGSDFDVEVQFEISWDDGGPPIATDRGVIVSINEFGRLINEILKALRTIYDKIQADSASI
jgi:hypothetical protein